MKQYPGQTSGTHSTTEEISYGYNADNEILFAGDTEFEFDLNGNMISKNDPDEGETQYVYNRMGKLSKIVHPDGDETKFYYYDDGLRYKKVDRNGNETYYYWGVGSIPPLLSEKYLKKGADGTPGKRVSYLLGMSGYRLFSSSSGGSSAKNYFYLTDHLGSVYYVLDEKGNLVNQYDYDEFGVVLTKKEKVYNPMGFTGEQQHKEEDGMVYLRQRYYIPELGRFSQKEPIYFTSNFIYVNNNPIMYIDPTGLQKTIIFYGPPDALGNKRDKLDTSTLKGDVVNGYYELNEYNLKWALGKGGFDYVIIVAHGDVYMSEGGLLGGIYGTDISATDLANILNDSLQQRKVYVIGDFCSSGGFRNEDKAILETKKFKGGYAGYALPASKYSNPKASLSVVQKMIGGNDLKTATENVKVPESPNGSNQWVLYTK